VAPLRRQRRLSIALLPGPFYRGLGSEASNQAAAAASKPVSKRRGEEMRKGLRTIALWSVLMIGASLALSGPAFAGCEGTLAEFSGTVQSMKKGQKGGLVIDNRMGDKVKFIRAETSKVSDESGGAKPKADWDDLANGDYVSVCWNRMEKGTRKAYQVIVRPAPKESAEDE
jgi:hypothetical protein